MGLRPNEGLIHLLNHKKKKNLQVDVFFKPIPNKVWNSFGPNIFSRKKGRKEDLEKNSVSEGINETASKENSV